MGMDQSVSFPSGQVPPFAAVRDLLTRCGFPVQMRMIDGNLAFPDEMPEETWRELRLGTPPGMVTVRREPGRVVCVTWGNADPALVQAWNAVTWAFAAAGEGQVLGPAKPLSAAEYEQTADLPAVFGSHR
jgi:hypothetical protein